MLRIKKLIMMQQARQADVEPHADRVNKSNLYYTRGITPKRVTSE